MALPDRRDASPSRRLQQARAFALQARGAALEEFHLLHLPPLHPFALAHAGFFVGCALRGFQVGGRLAHRQRHALVGVACAQVLALAGANTLAGVGFAAIGLAGLGASIPLAAGVHLVSVGALGLAVLAIFSIAGLRHTGHALVLPWQAKGAFALIVLAAAVRTVPDLAGWDDPHGLRYLGAAIAWTAAFAVWLHGYLPIVCAPPRADSDHC